MQYFTCTYSFTLFGVAQFDEVLAFDVELSNREKHRSTRCGYRFLNECVKRLHRNHASWAKFKRAWSVLEWVTASSRAKCPICSLSSTPGHPMKFRLTNSVINNNGSSHLYCQFHFVNNAIFLFNVTFTLIGCLCRK